MSLLELESFDRVSKDALLSKWYSTYDDTLVTFEAGRTNNCCKMTASHSSTLREINIPIKSQQNDTITCGFAYKTGGFRATSIEVALVGYAGNHFEMSRERYGPTRSFRTSGVNRQYSAINFSTFRYLEIQLYANASGSCIVKLDGITIFNYSGDTIDFGTIDALRFTLGVDSDNPKFIDDLYILNDSGSANNDFLGPIQIETLYPNGNGNTNNFSGSDGNSVDNYLLVDEETADNDSSYVEDSVINNKDLYNYTNLSIPNIESVIGVQVQSYINTPESGAKRFKNVARSNVTENDSAEFYLSTPQFQLKNSIYEQDPNTASAWSEAGVNASQFGVKVTA